jgi:hypothetical protein
METKNTDIKNVESKIYNHTEKKELVKKIEKLTSKNQYKQIIETAVNNQPESIVYIDFNIMITNHFKSEIIILLL